MAEKTEKELIQEIKEVMDSNALSENREKVKSNFKKLFEDRNKDKSHFIGDVKALLENSEDLQDILAEVSDELYEDETNN